MTSIRKAFIGLFPKSVQPMLDTALSSDLYLGCVLGAGAGYWAIAVSAVEHTESTDLLALAGAGVGLLAATLAAIALLLGFMTGRTLDLIRKTTLATFVQPFRLIAIVDALAILVSVAGAIDSTSITKSGAVNPGPSDLASVLFGVAIGLFVWAVVGVAQLVRIFINYGNVYLGAAEDAAKQDNNSPDVRRDRLLDERLNDRFASATDQLGNDKPAVRLVGVYAMAGLADDWPDQRQFCVDVLCGYLRMPYEPDPGDDAPAAARQAFQELREVRHTVIRVITAHLKHDTAVSWQGLNFDFTGAVFDGGTFAGAEFSGGEVCFDHAVFSGGEVCFDHAVFSGGEVRFTGAQFSGGAVRFDNAVFSGGAVRFDNAVFSAGAVSFDDAVFSGGAVSFDGTQFSAAGLASFTGAQFSGGAIIFADAVFSGGAVRFGGAVFSGGAVSFDDAVFSGGAVSFGNAQFSGGTVLFSGVQFSGGAVGFGNAQFSGGTVNFTGAQFSGGTVDFRSPGDWSVPPQLPTWEAPPHGVLLPSRQP